MTGGGGDGGPTKLIKSIFHLVDGIGGLKTCSLNDILHRHVLRLL